MRAIVIHAARDLRIEEREPGEPGPGEVAVRIGVGGICGSDLHYYNHGGFGVVRLQEPMILGHEISGTIASLGAGVTGLSVGDKVAVNPSRPCGHCRYCLDGLPNHCANMRFYGSAMPMPHIQGGFRETLVCDAHQCVPADVELGLLALAEPFAVALHGVSRAGSLMGKRVLVTGSGPIGALVVAAARHQGATEIIASDVVDAPLSVVQRLGADRTINAASDTTAMTALAEGKGTIDVMMECSGNERALRTGIEALRPRGILVQLGLGNGDVPMPLNRIVAKEVALRGSFRFADEFALAVRLIGERRVDLRPLITATYAAADAVTGFEAANDRRTAMKVQLAF